MQLQVMVRERGLESLVKISVLFYLCSLDIERLM